MPRRRGLAASASRSRRSPGRCRRARPGSPRLDAPAKRRLSTAPDTAPDRAPGDTKAARRRTTAARPTASRGRRNVWTIVVPEPRDNQRCRVHSPVPPVLAPPESHHAPSLGTNSVLVGQFSCRFQFQATLARVSRRQTARIPPSAPVFAPPPICATQSKPVATTRQHLPGASRPETGTVARRTSRTDTGPVKAKPLRAASPAVTAPLPVRPADRTALFSAAIRRKQ